MTTKQMKLSDIGGGDNIKGINFDAWGGIDNFLRETSTGGGGTAKPQLLRRVLPWLAKATDMTALAISTLPFEIRTDSGSVVDSSADWKNKLGGIPSYDKLMYNLAASLCLGKAYVIPQYTNRLIVDMHYCAPHTVVPLITVNGLQQFSRTSDYGESGTYAPLGMYEQEEAQTKGYTGEMMYFWLHDSDIEIGPAKSYPAGVALLSSELFTAIDSTLQTISERGFVPPTLLSVKGMPTKDERDKTENWFNRFLRRWSDTTAKVINSESMDIKAVGAGMDALTGIYTEIIKQSIENIGTAYGIPAALFMSDMAFATEVNPMIKMWYSTSVFIKIYSTIEATFNEQLLSKWGMKLVFMPDTLDAFQEDETKRAGAYREYISTDMRPSIAAEMLGLDLPEGKEYAALDEFYDKRLSGLDNAKPVNPLNDPSMPKLETAPVVAGEQPRQPKQLAMNADQIKDLDLWRQMAVRFHRKHKGNAVDFECKALPENIAAPIRVKLAKAENELDIIKAFDIGELESESDILKLANAIEKAVSSAKGDL